MRTLTNMPITDWIDFKKAHPGLIRYIKVGAFSGYGYGPMKLGKGLAEILDLPLYAHIGEHQLQPGNESAYEIYRVSEAGDIVTHVYHGNECGILDRDGKVRPVVQAAKDRGVLFDVGFGGFNFSWRVAETRLGAGLLPRHHQVRPAAVQRRGAGLFARQCHDLLHEARHVAATR